MNEDRTDDVVRRPPLRTFLVKTRLEIAAGPIYEDHKVSAHLVFNNLDRGEGLVFRRYYDDSVRTEKVAEFPTFEWYKEIDQ